MGFIEDGKETAEAAARCIHIRSTAHG